MATQTQLTGVPRTMLMTTRARVDEQQRSDAIFQDPTVTQWWQSITWDPALDGFYTSLSQLSWAVRAHLYDQIVQRYLAKHPQAHVIELGAGLSTRYYRIGQNCERWIDLDLPEVTALRRQFDPGSDNHHYCSQSVLDLSWMDQLNPSSPDNVLIMAEGLLMYFEATQVRDLIQHWRQRWPGATLVFDVVGGATRGKGAKILADLGAPLKWFVKNEQDVAEMGVSLVQVRSLIQENCNYPQRIGFYRCVPWLSKLPAIRNSSLILETTLDPLPTA